MLEISSRKCSIKAGASNCNLQTGEVNQKISDVTAWLLDVTLG